MCPKAHYSRPRYRVRESGRERGESAVCRTEGPLSIIQPREPPRANGWADSGRPQERRPRSTRAACWVCRCRRCSPPGLIPGTGRAVGGEQGATTATWSCSRGARPWCRIVSGHWRRSAAVWCAERCLAAPISPPLSPTSWIRPAIGG